MRILDAIFGRSSKHVNQPEFRRNENNDPILEDFEPIVVDPNKSLDEPKGRPPIIFENG